jgi:hypothetical protein
VLREHSLAQRFSSPIFLPSKNVNSSRFYARYQNMKGRLTYLRGKKKKVRKHLNRNKITIL